MNNPFDVVSKEVSPLAHAASSLRQAVARPWAWAAARLQENGTDNGSMKAIDLLFRPLSPLARAAHKNRTARIEATIPKVMLRAEHIGQCRLLLDREALLRELPVGAVGAEIGVDQGEFSERILTVTQPMTLHLVDSWESRRFSESKFEQVRNRFARPLAQGRVRIHRQRSLDAVANFEDGSLDWVYVDTDHSYTLTARELRAYAPKLKPGGLMAGHDYSMGNWSKGFRYGVIEAVHEFCVEAGWELIFLTLEPIERQSYAIRKR